MKVYSAKREAVGVKDIQEDEMKRCAGCNRKRGVISRLFGLDKEYCDNCLLILNQEIREKHILPVRRQKDDSEGKA